MARVWGERRRLGSSTPQVVPRPAIASRGPPPPQLPDPSGSQGRLATHVWPRSGRAAAPQRRPSGAMHQQRPGFPRAARNRGQERAPSPEPERRPRGARVTPVLQRRRAAARVALKRRPHQSNAVAAQCQYSSRTDPVRVQYRSGLVPRQVQHSSSSSTVPAQLPHKSRESLDGGALRPPSPTANKPHVSPVHCSPASIHLQYNSSTVPVQDLYSSLYSFLYSSSCLIQFQHSSCTAPVQRQHSGSRSPEQLQYSPSAGPAPRITPATSERRPSGAQRARAKEPMPQYPGSAKLAPTVRQSGDSAQLAPQRPPGCAQAAPEGRPRDARAARGSAAQGP